jgi:N-acetylglucosaminyldiphosphoundecaprenol N-acetyl-beta-D-mannosaminyltransferase
MMNKVSSYNILGVKVNPLTISDLNSIIKNSVDKDKKLVIANHNVNSLCLYHRNPKMRDFYKKADYTHIDGMALIFLGKLLDFPLEKDYRVTYVDWVWSLMSEAASKGWRIFYLGSKEGVAAKGAKILKQKYRGLEIATADGYFDPSPGGRENAEILTKINQYQPHILMVGMGMPRQEQWILENFQHIKVNSILPSGACLDYVAGEIPTPPRWLGRVGLEWLYRLLSEPKRLWKRYLLEPWFLLWLLCKELWIKNFDPSRTLEKYITNIVRRLSRFSAEK